MSYSKDERECIIRMDEESDYWTVYSASPRMITKLFKIGEENIETIRETKTDHGTRVEGEYKIPLACAGFRKPMKKKELTEEERQKLRDRFKKNIGQNTDKTE